MEVVDKEIEKVLKKHKQFHKNCVEEVDTLIASFNQARNQPAQVASQTAKVVKDISANITSHQKDYYGSLSKLQKAVDKKFSSNDLDAAFRSELFPAGYKFIDYAVSLHMVREGLFDICQVLNNDMLRDMEGGAVDDRLLTEQETIRVQFGKLYSIIESMEKGDLQSAIQWAHEHQDQLDQKGSGLEFQLRRMQFLLYLSGANTQAHNQSKFMDDDGNQFLMALKYAQKDLGVYGQQYGKEIGKLMGAVAVSYSMQYFVNSGIASPLTKIKNPYNFLLTSPAVALDDKNPKSAHIASKLENLKISFVRDFCSLIGMSQESPLFNVVDVGVNSIPILVKLRTVIDEGMKSSKKKRADQQNAGTSSVDEGEDNGQLWTTVSDVLPVELPLPKSKRYHSVFACPVSREQTSDLNPPMMLPCGHVLSLDSLVRVAMKGRTGAQIPAQTTTLTSATPLSASAAGTSDNTTNQPPGDQVVTGGESENQLRMRRERERDLFAGVNINAKLKCPYCPQECTVGQGLRVYF
ncbi:hypothetical protein MIR68_009660 [Amoeboaphelidium protococcarum]|nr:hypothetical protein MIR68_009660 [Amoeboaphelidium protococcarum]